MSIYKHYLQKAAELINTYDGSLPLHHFLKQFFSQYKKYGSRDRKWITNLCYNYYRTGKALPSLAVEEKILLAYYLCNDAPDRFLEEANPLYNQTVSIPLKQKIGIAGYNLLLHEIFPFDSLLSSGIDVEKYSLSMLQQPAVFFRVRPGKMAFVQNKLDALGWSYKAAHEQCIKIESGLPIDKNFALNKEIVIQDLNSQNIGAVIAGTFFKHGFNPLQLWDCCAASGGKSIMMHDLFPGLQITVSDIRPSILHNLQKRFKEAGINKYHSFIADLTIDAHNRLKPFIASSKAGKFIIADVPCTGSGTWSRTPEQLFFFDEKEINVYAERQVTIAKNAIKYLMAGDWLVYITCSVFAMENEEVISQLMENSSLQLVHQQLLDGTEMQADSMFVAIMKAV